MNEPRFFTRVDPHPTEKQRYEVESEDGYIGDVFTMADSKASPSKRCWVAELEHEVVGTAKTRMGAALILGTARRKTPPVKVPRKSTKDDLRTFRIIQPVLFLGGMESGSGERPKAKAERVEAAGKVLTDYADVMADLGITAKVARDGFVCISPAALEKLLALVDAA